MSVRGVRRPISGAAETVIPFAANATNSAPRSKILLKILLLAAFAIFLAVASKLVVVTVPILSRGNIPPVPANSTLKCYDSAGKYQPCLARASASQSRLAGRTAAADQLESWAATALYPLDDHSATWATSAPTARRGTTSERRRALARCGRRLMLCVFSALEKGLTHVASIAATVGQARSTREHL